MDTPLSHYDRLRPRYMELCRSSFQRRMDYPVLSKEWYDCVYETRLLIRQDRRENPPHWPHPTRLKEMHDLVGRILDMQGGVM